MKLTCVMQYGPPLIRYGAVTGTVRVIATLYACQVSYESCLQLDRTLISHEEDAAS